MKKITFLYHDEQEGAELLFNSTSLKKAKKKIIIVLKKNGDFWKKAIKRVDKNPEKFLQIISSKQLKGMRKIYKDLK